MRFYYFLLLVLCFILVLNTCSIRFIKERGPYNTFEEIEYEWRDIDITEATFHVDQKVTDETVCGLHLCPDRATIERIDNAVIVNPEGLVYDDKKRIHSFGYWFWKNKKINKKKINTQLEKAYSFVRIWEWTFQHAAMGSFPKALHFCDNLNNDKEYKIIVVNNVQKNVIQYACPSLEDSRFWFLTDKPVMVKELFVIHWVRSAETNQGRMTLAASPKGILKLPHDNQPDTLFYMKRERSLGRRYVINENAVLSTLKRFSKYSGVKFEIFNGDVDRLKNAAYIVGPHGGAIANLIYTNQKTKIVEFITKRGLIERPCYDLLAQTLSLEYYYVEPKKFNFEQGGMIVDVNELQDLLNNI